MSSKTCKNKATNELKNHKHENQTNKKQTKEENLFVVETVRLNWNLFVQPAASVFIYIGRFSMKWTIV